LVDGLSSKGSIYNSPGVRINYDAWDEIQIISDPVDPGLGHSQGGIINIVTKTGGNELHGEVGALIRDKNLRAERKHQLSVVSEPNTSIHNYFGNLGGPIIKDKLWFFFSDNFHRTADDSDVETEKEDLTPIICLAKLRLPHTKDIPFHSAELGISF
jgi:hypothetical protein